MCPALRIYGARRVDALDTDDVRFGDDLRAGIACCPIKNIEQGRAVNTEAVGARIPMFIDQVQD